MTAAIPRIIILNYRKSKTNKHCFFPAVLVLCPGVFLAFLVLGASEAKKCLDKPDSNPVINLFGTSYYYLASEEKPR